VCVHSLAIVAIQCHDQRIPRPHLHDFFFVFFFLLSHGDSTMLDDSLGGIRIGEREIIVQMEGWLVEWGIKRTYAYFRRSGGELESVMKITQCRPAELDCGPGAERKAACECAIM
jgi:hypothetical protein